MLLPPRPVAPSMTKAQLALPPALSSFGRDAEPGAVMESMMRMLGKMTDVWPVPVTGL